MLEGCQLMKHSITLLSVKQGERCVVGTIQGGDDFQRRLRNMGVREGKKIKMVARHPLAGPLVIEVDDRKLTIGRGMAAKIAVICDE
jgi:ferrous iron transport protein A